MNKDNFDSEAMNHLFEEAMHEAARLKSSDLMAEASQQDDRAFMRIPIDLGKDNLHQRGTRSRFAYCFRQVARIYSRAAGWGLLIIIFFTIMVPNVSAARDWMTRLVINANPEYVTYYLMNDKQQAETDADVQPLLPVGLTEPSFIPKGMKLIGLNYRGDNYSIEYEDPLGKFVNIEILSHDSIINLDNEDLLWHEIKSINGVDVSVTSKNGLYTLVWVKNDRLFILTTDLSKSSALNISKGLIKEQ